MFEQESYDKATIQVESQPGGLFHNYEIKPWGFSPAIYKIIALSAILNLAFLAAVSQTNVLTARGCDSPWVGRVCQVVDLAYVGAMLYGTEREYVDEAYDNIDLGDAEITYIDVTGAAPLEYPEGYFQLANPVQYAMLQQMSENPAGLGTSTPYTPLGGGEPDLLKIQPNPPAANPDAFKDDPSPLFKVEDNASTPGSFPNRKGRGGRIRPGTNANSTSKEPGSETVAGNNTNAQPTPQATPTDPIAGVDINKRPMVDLGNWVNEKVEKKEVDLQTQFMVNAKGKLDKNGRLDPKTFSYITAMSSDEDMVEVVKRSIEALNVAGYLQYLKDLSGKDFNLLLQQDTENISAVVQSEMESDRRATSIKSGLDLLISIAKSRKSAAEADQNDKDDLVLLENATVVTDGKKVVIKFTVPKAVAHPMIQRKLAEQAAELQKPSGTTSVKPENNTAVVK
jgi:hypothetical protein